MVGTMIPLPPGRTEGGAAMRGEGDGPTEAERSAAMLFAHERLLTALLREIAQNDPAIAASIAAGLAEDVARARVGGTGEAAHYLVCILEDYLRALGTPNL